MDLVTIGRRESRCKPAINVAAELSSLGLPEVGKDTINSFEVCRYASLYLFLKPL